MDCRNVSTENQENVDTQDEKGDVTVNGSILSDGHHPPEDPGHVTHNHVTHNHVTHNHVTHNHVMFGEVVDIGAEGEGLDGFVDDVRDKVGFVSTAADDRTSFMSTDSSEDTALPSNDSTDNVSVVVRSVPMHA